MTKEEIVAIHHLPDAFVADDTEVRTWGVPSGEIIVAVNPAEVPIKWTGVEWVQLKGWRSPIVS